MRPTSDHDRVQLKTALKRLIVSLGGYDAAASCSRLSKTHLHRAGNIDEPECLPPVDVIADLERVAGTPLVTQALATLAGCTLLPVSLGGQDDLTQLLELLGRDMGQTMGDAMHAICGGMVPADMQTVLADLSEITRVAMLAHGRIRTILSGAEQ